LVDGWGGSLVIDQSGPDGTSVVMTLRAAAHVGSPRAALS
jgi:hypothetical protein